MLDEYVTKWRSWLAKEREADRDQFAALLVDRSLPELCAAGACLSRLHIREHRRALGGRTVVTLNRGGTPLPSHRFSPGAPAGLSLTSDYRTILYDTVVSLVDECSIAVALERRENVTELLDLAANRTFVLTPQCPETTYKRMEECLSRLANYRSGSTPGALVEYAFHARLMPVAGIDPPLSHYFDSHLNESQCEAVNACMNPLRPITVIHGPPGTGKTRTVVEVIRQCVHAGQKVSMSFLDTVLLCAPSNVAVDNVVARVGPHVPHVLRMGHPARSHASLMTYCFDYLVARSDHSRVVGDIEEEIKALRDSRNPSDQRRLHTLKGELRKHEQLASQLVLQSANVVCCTLTTAAKRELLATRFDVVIIDECAQATELACWIALLNVPRCVLAGDHKQLPPTIISEEYGGFYHINFAPLFRAAREGFSQSLMDRLARDFRDVDKADAIVPFFFLLTVQYRMHETIMQWSSRRFYHGKLLAHAGNAAHLLSDCTTGEFDDRFYNRPICLIDTDGCEMHELAVDDDESKANIGEVQLAYLHVKALVGAGMRQEEIAVISPYNLQVQLLRLSIGRDYPHVGIRSVDGFQGQEREAVILSLVRSNKTGEIGFLAEERRMNVAVTRARRHLAIICDSRCVSSDATLASLINYARDEGEMRSALEFDQDELNAVPLDLEEIEFRWTGGGGNQAPGGEKKNPQGKKAPKSGSGEVLKQGRPRNALSVPLSNTVTRDKHVDSTGEMAARSTQLEDDLNEELTRFLAGNEESHEFPPSLSANGRRIVHELAEHRGLAHESRGEGGERRIVVSKRREEGENGREKEEVEEAGVSRVIFTSSENAEPQSGDLVDKKKAHCNAGAGGDRPVSNRLPSSEKSTKSPADPDTKTMTSSSKLPQKNSASKTSNSALKKGLEIDEEEGKLLDAAVKANSLCAFGRCERPVAMISTLCPHCRVRFCLNHGMPEIHGCGDAARADARRHFDRDARGAAPEPKSKSSLERKENLQKKMDEKLENLKKSRAAKKK